VYWVGFAMGSRIAAIQFKNARNDLILALIFASSAPVGIAIGTGLASTYSPNSPTALLVSGFMDAFSAGIIFYMAFVAMIGTDFVHDMRTHAQSRSRKVQMYVAVWFGAGAMALLGYWL
jgi:zinc transporter 1/2/3